MRLVSAWFAVALVATATGCAPPDPIELQDGGEPTISILYPSPTTSELPVDADGNLHALVVVDINNFEYVPPGTTDQVVEGQGHWHIFLDPLDFYAAPTDLFYDTPIPGLEVGQSYRLRVTLQNNDHSDPPCAGVCTDAVEFTAVDMAAADTDL
jgi:hypothetical protein